jgi:hypothetical protein
MRFPELLIEALKKSEIPLRFEPGAEESVAKQVTDLVRLWLEIHEPKDTSTAFSSGQKKLIDRLLAELEGAIELPGEQI